MRKNQITLDNSEHTRQLREELPGSWYNYEAEEDSSDFPQSNHWLSQPDETQRLSGSGKA